MQAVQESKSTAVASQVSSADEAVKASQAIEKLLTSFQATRETFRQTIGRKWEALESFTSVSLADIGADCAQHIATGLLAGLARADLVKDCKAGLDLSDSDVTQAVKLHKLSELSGVDCSTASFSRVRPLLALVKRDSDDETYSLLGGDNAKALIGLVADNDATLANRKAIGEAVAKLLGKSPAESTKSEAAKPDEKATEQAPSESPKSEAVQESQHGATPLDAAQAAYRAIASAKDTGAAAHAFGTILGQNPKTIAPIVKGLAEWVKSEKTAEAARIFGALMMVAKSQAKAISDSGLPIAG